MVFFVGKMSRRRRRRLDDDESKRISVSDWDRVPDSIMNMILSFVDGNWLMAQGSTINKHVCRLVASRTCLSNLHIRTHKQVDALLKCSSHHMANVENLVFDGTGVIASFVKIMDRLSTRLRRLSFHRIHVAAPSFERFTNLVHIDVKQVVNPDQLFEPIWHQLKHYQHQICTSGAWFEPPPNVDTLIVPYDAVHSIPLSIRHLHVRGGCMRAPMTPLSHLTCVRTSINDQESTLACNVLLAACVPGTLTHLEIHTAYAKHRTPARMPLNEMFSRLLPGLRVLHIQNYADPSPCTIALPSLPLLEELSVSVLDIPRTAHEKYSTPLSSSRHTLILSGSRPGYPSMRFIKLQGLFIKLSVASTSAPASFAPASTTTDPIANPIELVSLFPNMETCVLPDDDATICTTGSSHLEYTVVENAKRLYCTGTRRAGWLIAQAHMTLEEFSFLEFDESAVHGILNSLTVATRLRILRWCHTAKSHMAKAEAELIQYPLSLAPWRQWPRLEVVHVPPGYSRPTTLSAHVQWINDSHRHTDMSTHKLCYQHHMDHEMRV